MRFASGKVGTQQALTWHVVARRQLPVLPVPVMVKRLMVITCYIIDFDNKTSSLAEHGTYIYSYTVLPGVGSDGEAFLMLLLHCVAWWLYVEVMTLCSCGGCM